MQPNSEDQVPRPQFVQFLGLRIDPDWRRLSPNARAEGRSQFASVIEDAASEVTTYTYGTLGLKVGCDLMLWRKSDSPVPMQEMTSQLLLTGLGAYMEPSHSLFGFTRPSTYTRRPTTQEQAVDVEDRCTYLIVYPFSKTTEWYLMSKDARQGMMNEHMRIGHEYADVRQVLLYATGLDDQEFVVAYETDDLPRFQSLVIDLRATEARRYTLRDTPILTGIHRPVRDTLALLG
jgi:chlorite dismutase